MIPAGHNDTSRLAGIVSLVRYDSFNIDKTPQLQTTVDKVSYNGQFYSSKPPVLTVLTAKIVSYLFKFKSNLINNDSAIYRVSTFLTVVIPFVGIFVVFLLISKKLIFKEKKWLQFLTSFLLIFGTLIFTYSNSLNNHVLEAFLQILLFYFLFIEPKKTSQRFFLIGILVSAIFVVDITYGFVVAPITFIYILLQKKIKFLSMFIIGALPLILLHFILNYLQFGIFLPPQLFPNTYLNYLGSNWINVKAGMEAQNHGFIATTFNYVFGTYGLFLYQPFLLLAFAQKKTFKKPQFIYMFLILIFYLLFNVITSPNYGGSSFGPRRFLPLIPLLYYFSVQNVVVLWQKSSINRIIILVTLVLTIIISVVGYTNPWNNWDNINTPGMDLYFPLLYSTRVLFNKI